MTIQQRGGELYDLRPINRINFISIFATSIHLLWKRDEVTCQNKPCASIATQTDELPTTEDVVPKGAVMMDHRISWDDEHVFISMGTKI